MTLGLALGAYVAIGSGVVTAAWCAYGRTGTLTTAHCVSLAAFTALGVGFHAWWWGWRGVGLLLGMLVGVTAAYLSVELLLYRARFRPVTAGDDDAHPLAERTEH